MNASPATPAALATPAATTAAAAPAMPPASPHQAGEPHSSALGDRLNWLRAAVLGANDGVTSTAGVVVGVAGASTDTTRLLVAGVAALIAGSLSMAAGEYVSVSTQRDSERALLEKEREELRTVPDEELAELAQLYEAKGLSPDLAEQVAIQLTEHDALRAHADIELGIDPDALTNPVHAAFASMLSFALGAIIPVLTIISPTGSARIPLTFACVILALAVTGYLSARLGQAVVGRSVARNVAGGTIAMLVTYGIGNLVGGAVG